LNTQRELKTLGVFMKIWTGKTDLSYTLHFFNGFEYILTQHDEIGI